MICKCEGEQGEQKTGRGPGQHIKYKFICTQSDNVRTFRKYLNGYAVNDRAFRMCEGMKYPCGKELIK